MANGRLSPPSDACCDRNGQLEQMMEKDENKNNTFIRAKTLEKIHAHRNENRNLKKNFSLLFEN